MTAGEFWVLQDDDRMQLKEALQFLELMMRYRGVKGQRISVLASFFCLILFVFVAPRVTLNPTIQDIYSCGFIVVCHIIIHLEQARPTQKRAAGQHLKRGPLDVTSVEKVLRQIQKQTIQMGPNKSTAVNRAEGICGLCPDRCGKVQAEHSGICSISWMCAGRYCMTLLSADRKSVV